MDKKTIRMLQDAVSAWKAGGKEVSVSKRTAEKRMLNIMKDHAEEIVTALYKNIELNDEVSALGQTLKKKQEQIREFEKPNEKTDKKVSKEEK